MDLGWCGVWFEVGVAGLRAVRTLYPSRPACTLSFHNETHILMIPYRQLAFLVGGVFPGVFNYEPPQRPQILNPKT